jgi:hypothetical protein
MTKQTATATMEGKRKGVRPHEGWPEEVEEDLNVTAIKNRHGMVRERWE